MINNLLITSYVVTVNSFCTNTKRTLKERYWNHLFHFPFMEYFLLADYISQQEGPRPHAHYFLHVLWVFFFAHTL